MAFFKKKTPHAEEPMDLDAVMKKYDRESNIRVWEGKPKLVVTCILALFSLFCLYVTLFATWLEEWRLTSFVAGIIFLGYLVFPAKKGQQKVNDMPWYDVVLMVVGTGAFLYFTFNALTIIQQGSNFQWYQILIGIVGILSLAEVCRRSVGLPILIVAGAFIVYALIWGLANPSLWGKLNYTVRYLFYSKEGVLSTPINVCSKFIVVFIIFGAFLERTGIADFFIKIANALVGGFSGGPAKVAVVASALEGMVSGSSVANTVGSGAVTIPLMKRTGYKPEFAAAAEAAASTGGQIMPPIMGAAAFLMADYVQLPYSEIVVKAILPAILYFAGIFISVHLEAKKLGLRGLSRAELPRIRPMLKQLYLLLPLILLIYLATTAPSQQEITKIKAPDFTVYDLQGNPVRLSDFYGKKPVILNFWASWCGPCKMEMPDFQEKYLEWGEEVQFLMVNVTGGRETLENASAFIRQQGYDFPVFYDTTGEAATAYAVYSLPSTYFIDIEGNCIARAIGAINGETLQRRIDMIR